MEWPRRTFLYPLNTSQVLFRFLFRLVFLVGFAAMSSQGFAQAFTSLLALAAIFCAVLGALRQEAILGRILTHWDEAAAYAVISGLTLALA